MSYASSYRKIRHRTRARGAWSGFDPAFDAALRSAEVIVGAEAVGGEIEARLALARGWACRMGPPAAVRPEYAERVHRFAEAFHRSIQTVVSAYGSDARVRGALAMPRRLGADVERDVRPENGRVHLCRLDLMLAPGGGFRVLETNANCPASLVYGGMAARAWRSYLAARGVRLPAALDHEDERWAARWFVQAAIDDTGRPPGFVALLREEGGNRTELSELAEQFALEGIETLETDPREVSLDPDGVPYVAGRRVQYAYLKLGMREFARLRPKLGGFVRAVRSGALFVQNGQRGRWLGDNKLCLAVLSDPRFRSLFPEDDWALLRAHVPWSRNASLCSARQIDRVRTSPERYVLKRPLDTRARGVLIGREVGGRARWSAAVDRAVRESWLVQEFHAPTRIRTELAGGDTSFHDLAVGMVDGRVAGAFIRSSGQLRTNIALTGRMHPVFLGRPPEGREG